MTEAELDRIEALVAVATPGPWTAERDALGHWRIVWPHSANSSVLRKQKLFSDEDIEFIAAARTDVPALAAEVRRFRAVLGRIGEDIEYSPLAAAVARVALALTPPADSPPPSCD